MAENLRAKIPKNDTLIIYDSKNEITSKFAKEAGSSGKGASVEIGRNPREVAEKSVRPIRPPSLVTTLPVSNDEYVPLNDLSWEFRALFPDFIYINTSKPIL